MKEGFVDKKRKCTDVKKYENLSKFFREKRNTSESLKNINP